MRKLDYYWQSNEDWYEMKDNGACVIREDAPPEAQRSYQHYLEQCQRAQERMDAGESMD